jgi:hypothetical protein
MKTRRRLNRLAIALSLALLVLPRSSISAEEPGALPFLKVGSSYTVVYSGTNESDRLKILEPAIGQWFRVEVSGRRILGVPTALPSQLPPYEAWFNFANVLSVREVKEPEKKDTEKK